MFQLFITSLFLIFFGVILIYVRFLRNTIGLLGQVVGSMLEYMPAGLQEEIDEEFEEIVKNFKGL